LDLFKGSRNTGKGVDIMDSVFERKLPHENLNRAIAAAMRAANMTPAGDAPNFGFVSAAPATGPDVITVASGSSSR